jgi:hypothetical protein
MTPLAPADRLRAEGLGLAIVALLGREDKVPIRREAIRVAVGLLGDEAVLAPEANGSEEAAR